MFIKKNNQTDFLEEKMSIIKEIVKKRIDVRIKNEFGKLEVELIELMKKLIADSRTAHKEEVEKRLAKQLLEVLRKEVKQELRAELKTELKEELKQELRVELKEELKEELLWEINTKPGKKKKK